MPDNPAPHDIGPVEYSDAAMRYASSIEDGVDASHMRLGINLVRAANVFVGVSERRVHRPKGLSWSGFSAMFALSVFDALEARTISRLIGVTRQATSVVLATLERKGLITRKRPRDADGRLLTVRLTDEGRRIAREAVTEQNLLVERWFAPLTDDERAQLDRLLEKLVNHGDAADEADRS